MVLEVVDPHGRQIQQYRRHAEEEDEFVADRAERGTETSSGDPEPRELQDAYQTQKSKRAERTQIDAEPQVIRKDGEQVDDPVETEDEAQSAIRDNEPQQILDGEHDYRHGLDRLQQRARTRTDTGERLEREVDQRDDDERLDDKREDLARAVVRPLDDSLQIHGTRLLRSSSVSRLDIRPTPRFGPYGIAGRLHGVLDRNEWSLDVLADLPVEIEDHAGTDTSSRVPAMRAIEYLGMDPPPRSGPLGDGARSPANAGFRPRPFYHRSRF